MTKRRCIYYLERNCEGLFTSTTGLCWNSDKIVVQVKDILNSFPGILDILTIRNMVNLLFVSFKLFRIDEEKRKSIFASI